MRAASLELLWHSIAVESDAVRLSWSPVGAHLLADSVGSANDAVTGATANKTFAVFTSTHDRYVLSEGAQLGPQDAHQILRYLTSAHCDHLPSLRLCDCEFESTS